MSDKIHITEFYLGEEKCQLVYLVDYVKLQQQLTATQQELKEAKEKLALAEKKLSISIRLNALKCDSKLTKQNNIMREALAHIYEGAMIDDDMIMLAKNALDAADAIDESEDSGREEG